MSYIWISNSLQTFLQMKTKLFSQKMSKLLSNQQFTSSMK